MPQGPDGVISQGRVHARDLLLVRPGNGVPGKIGVAWLFHASQQAGSVTLVPAPLRSVGVLGLEIGIGPGGRVVVVVGQGPRVEDLTHTQRPVAVLLEVLGNCRRIVH